MCSSMNKQAYPGIYNREKLISEVDIKNIHRALVKQSKTKGATFNKSY